MHHQPDRHDTGHQRKQYHVCGEINLHLGWRPHPLKTQQQKKNSYMMISDMFLKMMIRETLTKEVKTLPRKHKQHRDLQRRGVREEPSGSARCSGLRRRRGLQGFWQRGSPGSGRGCCCRRRLHRHPHRQ